MRTGAVRHSPQIDESIIDSAQRSGAPFIDSAQRSGAPFIDSAQQSIEDPVPGRATLSSAQRVDRDAATAPAATPTQALDAAQDSPGAALPGGLRDRLETSLKADLSSVRVHDGTSSAAAAAAIGANAYTIGQDIHFAAGQFDPGSTAGQRLIAHETAHTVQQHGVGPGPVQTDLQVSAPGDAHEVQAEAFAQSFISGAPAEAQKPVSRGVVARAVIQRDPPTGGGQPTATQGQPGPQGQPTATQGQPTQGQPTQGGPEAQAQWQAFLNHCGLANTFLNQAYSAAEVFIRTCTTNYKQGYDAHKAALDRQAARDQLTQQIILGIIFAAAGGAIGGAAGVMVGPYLQGLSRIAAGAATDAVKDLAKYAARLPTMIRGGGSGGGNTTETPSQPTVPVGAGGQGRGAPAAVDPFTWHNNALTVLAQERTTAFGTLLSMQTGGNTAMQQQLPYPAGLDPVAMYQDIQRSCSVAGMRLDQLATLAVPSADDYEAAFWQAWLSQYGYRVTVGIGGVFYADQAVGKDLKAELDRVAGRFGQTADQWIQQYGASSRQRAEREADELNRIPRPMMGM